MPVGIGVYGVGQNYAGGTISTAEGVRGLASINGSGNISEMLGVRGYAQLAGTGDVNNIYGGYFYPSIDNAGAVATAAFGVRAAVYRSAGTVTTGYGVYIDDIYGTTDYGVFQSGADDVNYFAGNVGIGTTSPSTKLDVNGDFTASGIIKFPGVTVAGGYYLCLNNATGWSVQISNGSCTHSDRRLKTDIRPLIPGKALAALARLRPVSFKWKDQSIDTRDQFGLIAQEVETVYPNLVSEEAGGLKRVNYESLIAPLIAAVHELNADNEKLRAELHQTIDSQDAQIEEMRREIEKLKAVR